MDDMLLLDRFLRLKNFNSTWLCWISTNKTPISRTDGGYPLARTSSLMNANMSSCLFDTFFMIAHLFFLISIFIFDSITECEHVCKHRFEKCLTKTFVRFIMRTYIPNKHSRNEVIMMTWLKKNTHITILLGACLLFASYLYITDPGDVNYAEIQIEHGDSLWSLA